MAKSLIASVECISFDLPDKILQEIKGIPIAANPSQEDILIWAFSKDGSFSLKSAYLIAKGFNLLNLDTSPHQWVWKAHTSPRIKFFIWMCTNHSMPTKEVPGSRGLNLARHVSYAVKGLNPSFIHLGTVGWLKLCGRTWDLRRITRIFLD